MIISLGLFLLIFVLITFETINKAVLTLGGAVILLLLKFIPQEKAFAEIDWNVIFLLISMMIIVGITKQTGLFQYVAIKTAKLAKGNPVIILLGLSLVTAFFSAFLDNVTTVLIITPVTILLAVELGLSPVPFIIIEAIFSNIGGTATLIGDPPNIMIGSAANITFMDFIIYQSPVILVIIVVISIVNYLIFRKKLSVPNERRARIMDIDEKKAITDRKLLVKCSIVLTLTVVGFILHGLLSLEPATISLSGAAALMLLTGKKEIDEFFHEVEWTTIFFFIGLFMLVGGLIETGVIKMLSEMIISASGNDIKLTAMVILWASGFISGIVDNIPFVATMIPLLKNIGLSLGEDTIRPLWYALSLGACLGGNMTLIGASANVVSAGISGKSGYKISFLEFTKYGAIFTLISLAICTGYILLFLF